MLSDTAGVTSEQMGAAFRQQLVSAGVADDPVRMLGFLRWQVLRAWGPLREIAQNQEAGPIPLAAAHASDGLQRLLAVCETGQNPTLAAAATLPAELEAAREALTNAIANIDVMHRLLAATPGL